MHEEIKQYHSYISNELQFIMLNFNFSLYFIYLCFLIYKKSFMKKITTLLFILFALNSIQSQNYHPLVNAHSIWEEVDIRCPTISQPCIYTYMNYSILSDTTIYLNQKAYKVLQTYNPNIYALIREDTAKKVHLYLPDNNGIFSNDTGEFVIYDFNLNIGDTMITNHFNTSIINIVTDKDSITLNGESRVRFTIKRPFYGFTYYWIEGIGSDMGLLGNYYIPFEGSHELICYHHLTLDYISPQFTDCKGYLGIKENNLQPISISPNPATDKLTVNVTERILQLSIYTLTGKQIKTYRDIDNTIDISELPDGIYLLQLQTETGITYRKFIKQ